MDFVPGRNFALIKEQERMVHNPRKSMTADTFEKKNFVVVILLHVVVVDVVIVIIVVIIIIQIRPNLWFRKGMTLDTFEKNIFCCRCRPP